MNYQERVMLVADGFRNEIESLIKKDPHLGEDAKLVILASKIEDLKESLKDKVVCRQRDAIQGNTGVFRKIKASYNHVVFSTKFIAEELTQIMAKAVDIASDENFVPSTSVNLEEALMQVINDEYEIRGI